MEIEFWSYLFKDEVPSDALIRERIKGNRKDLYRPNAINDVVRITIESMGQRKARPPESRR